MDPVKEVNLRGVRLKLAAPRVVAETSVGHGWYPDILKFSTGEIMLNYSLNADANTNQHNSQAVLISTDQGGTFDFAYDVNGFHNGGGEVRVSLPDGRIVGVSTFLRPDPPGQSRCFAAHHWTYRFGGRKYSVEPWAAKVEGLPRDVATYPEPSRTWWARTNWFSDIVVLDSGQFVTTLSLRFEGDERESTVALVSEDEGYCWSCLSTMAGSDSVADAKEGFDEPCLIQLEDGDLMCVSRVGSGQDQRLARAYSSDEGKTWSELDRLAAYSVAPQILRLQNGVLALSTGRPGVFLWFSSDSRGAVWEPVDVMAFHNSVLDESAQMAAHQTTAYTAMIEAKDNRLFLVYDRTPFGWKPVPKDSGERSQIYLLEVSVKRE